MPPQNETRQATLDATPNGGVKAARTDGTGSCLNSHHNLEATGSLGSSEESTKSSVAQFPRNAAIRCAGFYLNNYVLLAFSAAIGFSTTALIIKALSSRMSVFQISTLRSGVAAVILWGLCRHHHVSLTASPMNTALLILLRGACGAAAFLTHAVAATLLPLSEFAFMSNSYPAVTAVLSWLFGMEQLGIPSWLGAIGCFCGNALLARPPFLFGRSGDWGMERVIGIACAISANFLFSFSFILLRYLGKNASTLVLAFSMHVVVVIFSIPFIVAGYPRRAVMVTTWMDGLLLLCTALMAVCIQYVLSKAFQLGPPSKTTVILMTNMLLSCAFGVVLFSERLGWASATGAALITVSVLLVVTQDSSPAKAQQTINDVENTDGRELPAQ